MDGEKLLIDMSKLAADLAAGKGEVALAVDVAAALYDQIGPARLREFGALLVAHALTRVEAEDLIPVQSDEQTEPTAIDQTMPADGGAHEGP